MAHVQGHMSHSKKGTVEYVVAYDNTKRKKPDIPKHVLSGDAGMDKMRETITGKHGKNRDFSFGGYPNMGRPKKMDSTRPKASTDPY